MCHTPSHKFGSLHMHAMVYSQSASIALTSTRKASMILYATLRESVEANRVTNHDEAYIDVLKPWERHASTNSSQVPEYHYNKSDNFGRNLFCRIVQIMAFAWWLGKTYAIILLYTVCTHLAVGKSGRLLSTLPIHHNKCPAKFQAIWLQGCSTQTDRSGHGRTGFCCWNKNSKYCRYAF